MFSDFFECKQEIVDNFLSRVDRNQPMSIHLMQAQLDAMKYGWKDGILIGILKGLKEMRLPHDFGIY